MVQQNDRFRPANDQISGYSSIQPAEKCEWKFRDVVRFKTYADEMRFVEGEFPLAEIMKRIEFD